jgi:hypothetical protein
LTLEQSRRRENLNFYRTRPSLNVFGVIGSGLDFEGRVVPEFVPRSWGLPLWDDKVNIVGHSSRAEQGASGSSDNSIAITPHSGSNGGSSGFRQLYGDLLG